jgi:arginine decarboxylase-like protein
MADDASGRAQAAETKKVIKRSKFMREEDEQIRAFVAQFGPNAWDEITEAMGGDRNKRQLRERWQNYLSPGLSLSYTEVEDCALITLHAHVGPQWAKIASVIGTKSAISVRNRHRSLQSMKARGVKPDYQSVSGGLAITNQSVPESPELSVGDFDLRLYSIALSDTWECDLDSFL